MFTSRGGEPVKETTRPSPLVSRTLPQTLPEPPRPRGGGTPCSQPGGAGPTAIREVSEALSGLPGESLLGPGHPFLQAEPAQRTPRQQLSGLAQAGKSTASFPPLPVSFKPWLAHRLCAGRLTYVISSRVLPQQVVSHYTGEKTEAQKRKVTCPTPCPQRAGF